MGQVLCFGCGCSLDETDHFRNLSQACEPCLKSIMFVRGISLAVYLESRPYPTAVLAHDHTVLSANSRFRALKLDREVVGRRAGEVIDCLYSSTLGRCGETEVCILCSLRQAVERTWRTGEGLRGISMTYPTTKAVRKTLEITTEKVADAVLVILANASLGPSSLTDGLGSSPRRPI